MKLKNRITINEWFRFMFRTCSLIFFLLFFVGMFDLKATSIRHHSIFSLGLMLWLLLNGRKTSQGKNFAIFCIFANAYGGDFFSSLLRSKISSHCCFIANWNAACIIIIVYPQPDFVLSVNTYVRDGVSRKWKKNTTQIREEEKKQYTIYNNRLFFYRNILIYTELEK